MKNNNFLQRFLLCIIAIPAIIAATYFLTWYNNLVMCLAIFIFAILGSQEVDKLLFKNINDKKHLPFFIPSLIVASTYLDTFLKCNFLATSLTTVLLILVIFAREISVGQEDEFKFSIHRISKGLFLLVYPNLLLSFLIMTMCKFKNGNLWFLFLILLVFANDTFCYIGGRLLGKGNRGIFKASPNKSIAGYITGYIFTFLVGYAYMWIFKDIFSAFLNKLYIFAIISVIISTTANLGDLTESVIKRTRQIKDSGDAIMGRGGILDSIDSILSSAPIFYLIFSVICQLCYPELIAN